MKSIILAAIAICISSPAMAAVVFNQPAAVNNCTSSLQKMALSRYLNGKSDAQVPSCYKPGSLKSTTPTINNCKSALERQALSRWMSRGKGNPPKCFKPATWVGHTKSWATCNNFEKQQVRLAIAKSDRAFPACYK